MSTTPPESHPAGMEVIQARVSDGTRIQEGAGVPARVRWPQAAPNRASGAAGAEKLNAFVASPAPGLPHASPVPVL
ncbi:MAG: hypothetical protein Q7Q73_04970 [Verrucomicrobiota bacterium JB024]|nr:hypothetical protein [Verrucomicrobiota bacterium JB024]